MRKRKVACINAYPEASNPGMLSVDFAFDFLAKRFPDVQFDLLSIEVGYEFNTLVGNHSRRLCRNQDQLTDYEAIIYWGDFLHWLGYGQSDLVKRLKKWRPGLQRQAVIDNWYQLILLEGRPDLLSKTISFGTTLYPLNAKELTNERYELALTEFLRTAPLVLLRDAFSAVTASQLSGRNESFFGCDCALLFDANPHLPKVSPQLDEYLVCSFGRSGENRNLTSFAENLAKALGVRLVKIEWLALCEQTPAKDLLTNIAIIKHAKFAITDVYHFSVTAWREGTPTICIGWGQAYASNTLADKKKEIFCKQHFADDYYLYVEIIKAAVKDKQKYQQVIKHCVGLLHNQKRAHVITQRLMTHVKLSGEKLVSALQALLT